MTANTLQLPENFWLWVSRGSVAAILTFGVLGVFMNFLPKIQEQERAEARMERLKEVELSLRARRDSLREQKILIQSDAVYGEVNVRDRLNMKQTGEEIFRFGTKEK